MQPAAANRGNGRGGRYGNEAGTEPDEPAARPLNSPAERARCTVATPQRPRRGAHAFTGRETPSVSRRPAPAGQAPRR